MSALRRLFRLLRPYWVISSVSLGLMLLSAGLSLVPPLLQREIIDGIIGSSNIGGLGSLVGALVGLYLLSAVVTSVDQYIRHSLGQRFILDLRVRLYAYLQRLSLSFYDQTSTGELMSRVTNDVTALEQFATHGWALIVVDVLMVLGATGVLLWLDWRLALLVLIPVPLVALSLRGYNTRVRPIYREARDQLGTVNARLQDSLSGIQVIQAFSREHQELKRFATESEHYFRARVRSIRYWATFFPATRFVASMSRVIGLGVGAVMVIRGSLSLGTLTAFISYFHQVYGPLNRLVEIDNMFQQAIAASERIFELLDTTPEIVDAPNAVELPTISGEVAFEKVHFAYGMDDAVLRDVSFHIVPGQVVALVGPSGAGKTSIANLLFRFYDPLHGRITVDGQDLRQVELASLRRQIAVVLQDTFLFNTSVRENLLFGKPNATQEELVGAAVAAYAHDFIEALPEGYDTEIGERGVRLSGGQKQRLALARAILADPRILILDEATSSVDAEAEYLIQQALDSVLKGRTALVIAHRLSTVRNADKIVALEEGCIVEVGDHHELLQGDGLYSQLYGRQLELATAGDGG